MPIYEYKCDHCKNIVEEHQSIHDKPLAKCKKCGGALKRIFSPAGIIFKGSGFYATDHGGSKNESKPKTEKTENAPSKQPSK